MKEKNSRKSKRSQEEIIGFVLIVLLVSIIAVVFLGIQLRKPSPSLPSFELESFLQSSMRYSTDCFTSPETRYSFRDLVVSCAEREESCLDNRTSCEVLNESAKKMLDEGLNPGQENAVRSYTFTIITESNRTILSLKSGGNCTGTRTYSSLSVLSSEMINSELEICSEG